MKKPREKEDNLPTYVTLRAGVELGQSEGFPITISRARRDRAAGVLPPADETFGNRHLWETSKFLDYLRSLLRGPPKPLAPAAAGATTNDNASPPQAA